MGGGVRVAKNAPRAARVGSGAVESWARVYAWRVFGGTVVRSA